MAIDNIYVYAEGTSELFSNCHDEVLDRGNVREVSWLTISDLTVHRGSEDMGNQHHVTGVCVRTPHVVAG